MPQLWQMSAAHATIGSTESVPPSSVSRIDGDRAPLRPQRWHLGVMRLVYAAFLSGGSASYSAIAVSATQRCFVCSGQPSYCSTPKLCPIAVTSPLRQPAYWRETSAALVPPSGLPFLPSAAPTLRSIHSSHTGSRLPSRNVTAPAGDVVSRP